MIHVLELVQIKEVITFPYGIKNYNFTVMCTFGELFHQQRVINWSFMVKRKKRNCESERE